MYKYSHREWYRERGPVTVFYLQTPIFQARPAGFEPAAGGLEVRCSVP
jgi:hypothetical protein